MLSAQHPLLPVYRALDRAKLRPSSRKVCLALVKCGGVGVTQPELAKRLNVTLGTVNNGVRQLREAGVLRVKRRGTKARATEYAFPALEHGSREHELSEANDYEQA